MTEQTFLLRLVRKPWFGPIQKLASLAANVAVILGIGFAAYQVHISTENDRRQTTLNVLKPTREESVLSALRRFLFTKQAGQPMTESLTERLIFDRDLLLNTYDSVAIHYFAGNIDRCLVKAHVRKALDDVVGILEYVEEPRSSYARIIELRSNLDVIVC